MCECDEGVLMAFPWSWCSPQTAEEGQREKDGATVYVYLLSIMMYSLLQAECSLS